MENKNTVVAFIKKNISLSAFFILFILFSLTTQGKFFVAGNLLSVLTGSTDLLVCALGGTFIIMMGSIDLAVGSMISLGGVVVAKTYLATGNLFLALLATWGVCALCYGIMGLAHVCLKVPTFIVTLGMLSIARAVGTMISGGAITMVDYDGPIKQIFGLRPSVLIVTFLAFFVTILVEKYMLFGRYTRLIGGNENVARLSGVNVRWMKVMVYLFAGTMTALGSIIMAGRIGSGSPSIGSGYELDVITAVVLGGTAQTGGVGGVAGTLVGVLTIGILGNGLVLWGMPSEVQLFVKGVVVILAVAVSTERKPNMIVK